MSACRPWRPLRSPILSACWSRSHWSWSTTLQPAARYRLLETVRDYAETKLRAGDGQAAVRDRHLVHFQRFAEEAEGRLFGADQAQWTARLEADDGNIRAALEWAAAGGDVAAGLRMVGNLHFHWWVTGRYRQGSGHARALLAAAGEVDPALHCGALIALGGLIATADDIRAAIPPLQEGLALARAAGDRKSTARALNWLGNAMVLTDPRAGLDMVDEAARLGAEVGDLFAQVDSTILSGWARAWTGDLIAAKVRFSAAAELARAAHQLSFQGEALASLCYPTICQGDFGGGATPRGRSRGHLSGGRTPLLAGHMSRLAGHDRPLRCRLRRRPTPPRRAGCARGRGLSHLGRIPPGVHG